MVKVVELMIRPVTLLYGSETKFFQYKKTKKASEKIRIWRLLYIDMFDSIQELINGAILHQWLMT